MNTRIAVILAAAACLAAPLANAGNHRHGHGHAPWQNQARVRVVHVEPVVRYHRHRAPVRECWNGRCRVRSHVRHDQYIVGYRVAWSHHGQHGVVQLPYQPGPYITVSFGLR